MDSEQTARDRRHDEALAVIATAQVSIAHSFNSLAHSLAVIAANTTGISPEEKAALKKATADLKGSHDRLQTAVDQASAAGVVKAV